MSTLTKLPVKYVLYTHFGYADQDFDSWNSGTNVSELDGVNYFAAHLDGLRELLTSPAYEGMLVLFFASGFEECLDGIAKGLTRDDLLRKDRLQFANQVRQEFDRMLSGHRDASHRIRVLTPIDFYDIFGRMRGFDVDNLRLWFVGLREGIRYDAPKIAEAIVRLRLLGTGVPVFRLDWDVIFRAERDPDSGSYKYISPPLQTWDCLSRLLQRYALTNYVETNRAWQHLCSRPHTTHELCMVQTRQRILCLGAVVSQLGCFQRCRSTQN